MLKKREGGGVSIDTDRAHPSDCEKRQMASERPEKQPSGAKAHVDLIALAARLKSCPDAYSLLNAYFPQPANSCPVTQAAFFSSL